MRAPSHAQRLRLAIDSIASAQHGLLTVGQARSVGLSDEAIKYRLGGEWMPVHAGVYLVAPFPLSPDARLLAAVIRAGPRAAASHRAAAWQLGLEGFTSRPFLELYARSGLRQTSGIVVHRTNDLPRSDVAHVGPIPLTNATRTLIDLGSVVDEEAVEIALESAMSLRLTSISRLQQRLATLGKKGRRGTAVIRKILDRHDHQSAAAQSWLEGKFLRMAREGRLPTPVRQHLVRTSTGCVRYIDFAYPHCKLGIEVGGRGAHTGPVAEQRDSTRHNELTGCGWRVLYFSYGDVVHRPHHVLSTIRRELA
jgi:very-short-patch-repair endonuclease